MEASQYLRLKGIKIRIHTKDITSPLRNLCGSSGISWLMTTMSFCIHGSGFNVGCLSRTYKIHKLHQVDARPQLACILFPRITLTVYPYLLNAIATGIHTSALRAAFHVKGVVIS